MYVDTGYTDTESFAGKDNDIVQQRVPVNNIDIKKCVRRSIMKENIFLIGFMGAGKSTIARTLKKEYSMNLVEMDEQIEAEQGMKISEIFAAKGEE